MKNLHSIRYISLLLLIPLNLLFADGPWEKFHIPLADISKEVLRDAIGILTIHQGVKKGGTEFKVIKLLNSSFIYTDTLLVKETYPISNFGYQRREGVKSSPGSLFEVISNYRYPIVERRDGHLMVVTDPIKNTRVWLSEKDLQQDYYLSVVLFDDVMTFKSCTSCFIEISHFTSEEERKVYSRPDSNSEWTLLHKNELRGAIKLSEISGNFINIAKPIVKEIESHYFYSDELEEIGWIQLRDEDGLLTIWIKGLFSD